MSEWQELPTHEGWWWMRYHDMDKAIPVIILDDGSVCGLDDLDEQFVLPTGDYVRYQPVAPPRDGEKLPRRFRWKQDRWSPFGVLLPSGAVLLEGAGNLVDAQQWPVEHAAEIEWID